MMTVHQIFCYPPPPFPRKVAKNIRFCREIVYILILVPAADWGVCTISIRPVTMTFFKMDPLLTKVDAKQCSVIKNIQCNKSALANDIERDTGKIDIVFEASLHLLRGKCDNVMYPVTDSTLHCIDLLEVNNNSLERCPCAGFRDGDRGT